MYLMIDNYDSFVYNLARYLEELGEEVLNIRNDKVRPVFIKRLLESGRLQGIVISPGPKSPKDCGMSGEVVREFAGKVPILGVCLGHQIIAYEFGATVEKGRMPMHGKVTKMENNGTGLFKGLPSAYQVTRYHSLVVQKEDLPPCFVTDAVAEDEALMAFHHIEYPIYGVQFHPEAVLTEYGHELLENFTKICRKWWSEYDDNHQKTAVL